MTQVNTPTWTCARCGARVEGFAFWADEICTTCGHVPLCGRCFTLHKDEVVTDEGNKE